MTRSDYELIAEVFAYHNNQYDGRTSSVADELADDIANALADDNPRFDRGRFLKACGVHPDRIARFASERGLDYGKTDL